MEISKYLNHRLEAHPAKRVNRHLREMVAHYIGLFPEETIPELSELVLDMTALMERGDVLGQEQHYVKSGNKVRHAGSSESL